MAGRSRTEEVSGFTAEPVLFLQREEWRSASKGWQCFRPYSKFRKADLSEDSYLNKCRLKRWKAEAPSIGVSLGRLNGCSEVQIFVLVIVNVCIIIYLPTPRVCLGIKSTPRVTAFLFSPGKIGEKNLAFSFFPAPGKGGGAASLTRLLGAGETGRRVPGPLGGISRRPRPRAGPSAPGSRLLSPPSRASGPGERPGGVPGEPALAARICSRVLEGEEGLRAIPPLALARVGALPLTAPTPEPPPPAGAAAPFRPAGKRAPAAALGRQTKRHPPAAACPRSRKTIERNGLVRTGRAGEFLQNDQRIGSQPEWIPINTHPPGQPRSGPAAAGQGRAGCSGLRVRP